VKALSAAEPRPPASPRTGRNHADRLHRMFEVGIILKGLDGLAELVGGLVLLLIAPTTINQLVLALTQHELSEDPHDLITSHLSSWGHALTGSSVLFGSLYLLAHGAVKVALVAALLRNKLWAYPWMIGVLTVFIGYQLYRLALTWSPGLALLTLFDAAVAWLTYREYQQQRRQRDGIRSV
jgi:uncharacterized membrane protein